MPAELCSIIKPVYLTEWAQIDGAGFILLAFNVFGDTSSKLNLDCKRKNLDKVRDDENRKLLYIA